jgi:hypothetical protein
MHDVRRLAGLVKEQTNRAWHDCPGAARVLLDAIEARLKRIYCQNINVRGVDFSERIFKPAELPHIRPVAVEDQAKWGAALEAIDSYTRRMVPETNPEKLAEALKKSTAARQVLIAGMKESTAASQALIAGMQREVDLGKMTRQQAGYEEETDEGELPKEKSKDET